MYGSMIVPPPLPSNVPRPPPCVSIPTPPVSAAGKGNCNSAAAKSSNGSLLDMTDMFITNKKISKSPQPLESRSKEAPIVEHDVKTAPTGALLNNEKTLPKLKTPDGTTLPSSVSAGAHINADPKTLPLRTAIITTPDTEKTVPHTVVEKNLSSGEVGVVIAPTTSSSLIITPPLHVCIAPRTLVMNNEVHTVVIPPASTTVLLPRHSAQHKRKSQNFRGSKPPAATGVTKDKLTAKAIQKETQEQLMWENLYDLRPSPSATFHHIDPESTCGSELFIGHTRIRSSDEKWRGVYWKHVDVHRYIARHYFGEPPKKK
ncbi:unnamed protein product [Phytomonas sp. Hart1]|nr:unnamed protein product [Phytomonas sp. Hart1]|eukprot:CCW66219.1 unnamed protein product [Phytomonas sp. isolate Hart1]